MDIAITHGNYLQWGGGEYVAAAMAEALDAPVYYGFGYDEVVPDDGDYRRLFDPPMRNTATKLADRVFQLRDLAFMWHGQHIPELHDYDVVIHSGNEFGWYVPPDDQTVLKYVHSPPRSSYDLFPSLGGSAALRAYATVTRTMYRPTVTYPERNLANSELVARRCSKYWGIDAEVIYPPVDVEKYGSGLAATDPTTYLTFNRLYRHKRTREIVEAFNHRDDARLIVGGDGPQRAELEAIASDNVEIRGYLSEAEKRRLLAEAAALIYNPQNEDFGIIPIEAFASGTPVIGIADGFTRYQIRDGVNGISYAESTPGAIYDAVRRFERDGVTMAPDELERFAEQFSRQRFEQQLRQAIDAAIASTEINPSFKIASEHPA